MTPPDDDMPPSKPPQDIPLLAWAIAGAMLALVFCVAVMFARHGG